MWVLGVAEGSDNFFEARIAAQGIEDRIHFQLQGEPVRLFNSLAQPVECLLMVAQMEVSHHVIPSGEIFAAQFILFQSRKLSLSKGANGYVEAGFGECFFENFRELCLAG